LLRISLQGQLPSGEVWSVNPVFRIAPESGPVDFEEATAVAVAVNGVTPGLGMRGTMSTGTSLTGCRVEARTYDGSLEALAEATRGAAIAGTGGSSHPSQTSVVISLRTSLPGASARGRLYWPATGMGIDAGTLRPTSGAITTFLNDVRTYFVALNAAVRVSFPGAVGLSVWSRTNGSSQVVNKLLAGDVLDTQRRRRDNYQESYATLAFPGA
jgi:hypothetical protein